MAKSKSDVKGLEPGDLLIHEESSVFCRDSSLVSTIALGGTVPANTELIGQPVKPDGSGAYVLVAAADIANATGVILDAPESLDGVAQDTASNFEFSILARGPAVVNKARLAANDTAATPGAITLADFVAALAAVNIIAKDAPAKESKQTT